MIIIWGSGWYGKCDEVPRLCHVETHFGHLYYIPLIPLGSYAVFGRNPEGGIQGVPVGVSIKSILLAWLRTAFVLGAIAGVVGAIVNMTQNRLAGAVGLGMVAGACIFMFVATKRFKIFTQAGYERAIDLAHRSGVTAEGLLMIEIAYGRLTAEQADLQLQKLEEKQQELARQEEERRQRAPSPSFDFGPPAIQ